MSINGLPAVNANNIPMMGSVSEWMGKLVSPLHASLLSKDGIIELADRVKFIVGVVLIAIIVIATKYSHLLRPASHSSSVSSSSTTLGGSSLPTPTPSSPITTSSPSKLDSTSPAIEPALSIKSALNEIDRKFDLLFRDLKQLNGTSEVEKDLLEFHRVYDQYKDRDGLGTYFSGIDYIEKNIRFLKDMRQNLFLAPIRMNDKGIIPQPPDGNCLFHSLSKGLELLKENLTLRAAWREEPFDHEALRERVVKWMRENIDTDPALQDYLDRAIGDYIEVRKGQYKSEREGLEVLKLMHEDTSAPLASLESAVIVLTQLESLNRRDQYEWYLARAGQPAFFASSAEMYAFSKIYPQIGIHIWRELNNHYTNNFDAPFNDSDLTINLAYNLSGDHFNTYIPPA